MQQVGEPTTCCQLQSGRSALQIIYCHRVLWETPSFAQEEHSGPPDGWFPVGMEEPGWKVAHPQRGLLTCSNYFLTSATQRLEFPGVEEKQWDDDSVGAHTILKIVTVESRSFFLKTDFGSVIRFSDLLRQATFFSSLNLVSLSSPSVPELSKWNGGTDDTLCTTRFGDTLQEKWMSETVTKSTHRCTPVRFELNAINHVSVHTAPQRAGSRRDPDRCWFCCTSARSPALPGLSHRCTSSPVRAPTVRSLLAPPTLYRAPPRTPTARMALPRRGPCPPAGAGGAPANGLPPAAFPPRTWGRPR